jgi:hypothetical protein
MSYSGKGDKPKPFNVNLEKFSENFDAIFGKNKLADKVVKQTEESINRDKDEHKTKSN